MPTAVPLDPDRDHARRLLQDELDSGGYQLREGVVDRVVRWIGELFGTLGSPGALPGWVTWAVLALVLVAVLAVLAFAARGRWRDGRLVAATGTGAVLEGERSTAAEHRRLARQALAAGAHDTAVIQAYRALTAGGLERTLLEDRPGSTAHEVAQALTPVFPDHGSALAAGADRFDAVRYGGHPADAQQARSVVELDAALAQERPALSRGAR